MMVPQLRSMSSDMRLKRVVLEAILREGVGLQPKTEPLPVVKQMMLAPLATWPVAETGSKPGESMKTRPFSCDGFGVEVDLVKIGGAALGDGAEGLFEDGCQATGLVAGLGVVVDGAPVAGGVLLPPVDAVDETLGDFGAGGAAGEEVFGTVDLGGFGEDGGATVADEEVDGCTEGGVGADAGVGVRAAALEADDEVGGGDGRSSGLIACSSISKTVAMPF